MTGASLTLFCVSYLPYSDAQCVSLKGFFLVVIFILIVIMSPRVVEGRPLCEEFAKASDLYSSVYQNANKFSMSLWLEQLPSGPSPKGPGH
ncbi:putative PAMP-induced secreted peptide 1 [Helianthus annuus]|nr:putative PAMP-induced secreted peptide 1 [Helianthus annuus]